MSDPIAQLIEAARAYRAAEEALDAFEDQPTRPGYHEAHKAEDRVPVHMAVVDAMARLDEVLRALGDAVPRCLLNSAHYYGSLAYRQHQPLDDNPHRKGTGEWHAWVSGWQLLRDVSEELEVKQARVLVEAIKLYEGKLQWAEQKLVEAMEVGLAVANDEREMTEFYKRLSRKYRDSSRNMHRRAQWTESVAAQAMTEGLRQCEALREEVEAWRAAFPDTNAEALLLEHKARKAEAAMEAAAPRIAALADDLIKITSEMDEPPGPLCGSMECLEEDDEGDW